MRVARAATVVALGAVLYRWLLRERLLNWGATEAEVHARLPGDELLDDADAVATRAVTVDAPPSAVWPWIAQMGPAPRGGAYTYDWIENRFGLNMHSADRVLPEFQRLAAERAARPLGLTGWVCGHHQAARVLAAQARCPLPVIISAAAAPGAAPARRSPRCVPS